MVLGKKGFSVVLLVFGVVISVYMVLLAVPTSAQNGGGTTNPTTSQNNQADGDCPGAEVVEEIDGSGSQTTPVFQINGDAFRVAFEVVAEDDTSPFFLNVEDESSGRVESASREGSGSGETFVNEGPGEFSLNINTVTSTEYTITVEDCTEAGQDDDNQEPTNQRPRPRTEPTIINIPNKPLPPTGGLPVYGTVAGFILAGAGLLGLGIGIGRDQRR